MKLKILLKDIQATIPDNANETDIGLDLVAIKKFKTIREGINLSTLPKIYRNKYNVGETILYDTGIVCVPEIGYYTEIIPRSSLSKTGWILSNSVGIVDPDYRGTLLIALTRVDPSAEEISLPFCKAQLVVRKAEKIEIEKINVVNSTARGSGGFGSTGERVNH